MYLHVTDLLTIQDGRSLSGTVVGAFLAFSQSISSPRQIMRLYTDRRVNRHVHIREITPDSSQLRFVFSMFLFIRFVLLYHK